jgi:class 3 adenylate cyclase/alpha-beta hydrolase superfamily lysophospholipase
VTVPETRYAKSGDINVAWSVGGQGPPDILYCSNWTSHVEAFWDWAPFARLIRRLATLGRVILFDLPGNGLSDPVSLGQLPTIEQWMDYVRVVMDAAGSDRAVVFAPEHGGTLGIPFVATHPDRVSALILYGTFARIHRSDDYPIGVPPDRRDLGIAWFLERWGTGRQMELTAPSLADDQYELELMGRAERYSASPGTAKAFFEMMADVDVSDLLSAVHVPTLVMHRAGDRWIRVEQGQYLAANIPGARYVELAGENHFAFHGDLELVIAETRSFLASLPEPQDTSRVLATILFTDIVQSTERASELGDRRWRELLDRHDAITRELLTRFRGREVKSTGDGFLATFDGAARAVGCALAIHDAMRGSGLKVRSGLHSGEVERRDHGEVSGIAVHAAARVAALAGAGETLVSQTVKDLAIGARLTFVERGQHTLKGVPGSWQLFAATA